MKQGHEFPTAEALATFCLTIGGIVSVLTGLQRTELFAYITCTVYPQLRMLMMHHLSA